jgi:hypothetical protein
MNMMKRKTRKAIRKSVKKALKKHGPQIAAGLAGGIASTLATLANTEAPGTKGKKSNLAALSRKLSDSVTGTDGGSRKKSGPPKKAGSQKGKRDRKRGPGPDELTSTA